MSAPILIRALGGLSIQTATGRAEGAATQPRRLALLALIARAGERGITRDKLLALLWPDAELEQGRRALNQALYTLRRDLDADELFIGVHELRLNPDVAACDVLHFEGALRAGRFEEAAQHYAGSFLDGFRLPGAAEFERWADEERTDLAHRFEALLERLARAASQRDEPLEAVRWWRRVAAIDPLDARVAAALMSALVAAGDCAAALQHARIYEVLVAQELDLPADAAVLELARRIRASDLTAPVAAPVIADAVAAPPPVAAESLADGVAVLPFTNPGDHDCSFSDGVSEEIIHALSALPALRVVARSASFAFRGPAVDLAEVGARLGVGRVVEGTVRQSGSQVRVTARLVDVATRRPLWAERCDGAVIDGFELQDEIAARIVARLSGEPVPATPAPRAPSARHETPELVLVPSHLPEVRARQVIRR